MSATRTRAALAAMLLAAPVCARADAAASGFRARAEVIPAAVRIGEPALYRGRLVVPVGSPAIRWMAPEPDESVTWGELAPRRASGKGDEMAFDTLEVEAQVQVFRLGETTIPGLRFEVHEPGGVRIGRVPMVRLDVTPMLAAADSNATLRPLRGPIAAPWWERVPWLWVVVGLVVLAAIAAYWMWRRRRRPAALPVEEPALDPAAEALRALGALRGLNLPAHERFAEHAFHLSRIARRFLESTARTPRPGDTTPELVHHLETAWLEATELQRLETLLHAWDLVKFARAPSSAEQARAGERSVEDLVKHWMPRPAEKAA